MSLPPDVGVKGRCRCHHPATKFLLNILYLTFLPLFFLDWKEFLILEVTHLPLQCFEQSYYYYRKQSEFQITEKHLQGERLGQ